MDQTVSLGVSPDEIAALRTIAALNTAASGQHIGDPLEISCSELGDELDTSAQTASRRLRALEASGLIERQTLADGQRIRLTDDGDMVLRSEYDTYRRIFEGPPIIELVGTVTGGMGEGRHYITLDGYMQQFVERLGYEPFPGTLNLSLTDESVRRRVSLEATKSIPIDGWETEDRTYGPATCYPATVEGPTGDVVENAHVIEPVRTHHDEDHLEVIAPEKLRDVLALEDGDTLIVRIGDRA